MLALLPPRIRIPDVLGISINTHAKTGGRDFSDASPLGGAIACAPRAGGRGSHVVFRLQSCIFGLSRNFMYFVETCTALQELATMNKKTPLEFVKFLLRESAVD